jgi:CBS domain-containing protein
MRRAAPLSAETASLFLHRVRDLSTRGPVTCGPETTAAEIARLLTREAVGSAVVIAEGRPLAIVTDRDLRRKVLAAGRDPVTTPAAAIMSAPLVTIRPDAFAFEALLEMTRREIHHLPVVDEGRLVGVVSSHDFLRWQSTHPVMQAREIGLASSLADLAALAGRTTALVAALVGQGGSAEEIGRLVAELNDRIVARVLTLTESALEGAGAGRPPVPYCWLLFGSEARREQTLRTDQDNGLVYADPPPELRTAAADYYARFAAEAIRGLIVVGFPRCPGNVMASNPALCQPVSVWAQNFRRWIDHPSPEEVLAASIHFDLRPLTDDSPLVRPLRDVVAREAPASKVFLGLLARDVVDRRVPVSLFGNVQTLASGPHRGTVDVKGAGATQLVGAARVHALELAFGETNTIERFRHAGARGAYTPNETGEIVDAYRFLLRLRLSHQLDRLTAGAAPDNHLDPRTLSHADALLFRDALKTVERVQAGLRLRFATDRLG